MHRYLLATLLFLAIGTFSFGQNPAGTVKTATPLSDYFEPLLYRNIGPFRGGRSVCAAGVADEPLTYYVGTTGGGVWKTEDAGQYWTNVSDGYFGTGSVGAVAVSRSHPNVVYAGMGEHAPPCSHDFPR